MVPTTEILQGNALEVLSGLPDAHFHCCVTSPPYWGLRDYKSPPTVWGGDVECTHEWGTVAGSARVGRDFDPFKQGESPVSRNYKAGQGAFCQKCGAWLGCLGLEPSHLLFIEHLVLIFREVWRVLRPDGTLWVNMGDSFAANRSYQVTDSKHIDVGNSMGSRVPEGLKPKDLCGIPWRLAFALQDDGWYLRRDIVWAKPNSMPESVADRPSTAHEYIFLLSKAPRYFYDGEAVKEPSVSESASGNGFKRPQRLTMLNADGSARGSDERWDNVGGSRNRRSVWEIATHPYADAHFATFPEELPETCILAGTSAKGCCSVCGAPWRRMLDKSGNAKHEDGETASAYESGKTANRLAKLRQAARARGEEYSSAALTIGWEPGCSCEGAEVVPCRVLEPFCGSGTTLAVGYRLGRSGVGIELNPQYITLAQRRIGKETAPLFSL